MQNDPRSVFLIGMMGAGKSTVGRLLAEQLHYQFVDADRELEARSGGPRALASRVLMITPRESSPGGLRPRSDPGF